MFDPEGFVADCRTATGEAQPVLAVKELLEEVLARPGDIEGALTRASGVEVLHRSDELTVVHVVIPAGLPATLPHEHRMWAVVGVYGGQEDNEFFRRAGGGLQASGGRALQAGDTLAMGDDTIHAIRNPLGHSALAAIHVYGGDLIGAERNMWSVPDHVEQPYDDSKVMGSPIRS